MTTTSNHVTDDMIQLVGRAGAVVSAPEPVDRSSIRRFAQAIMDDDPAYWDVAYAAKSAYGQIVAPPLFPLHAIRRHASHQDPLDRALDDPEYDGAGDVLERHGLPPLQLGLHRLLNGGNSVEVYSLAQIGDDIMAQSAYESIEEKAARSGPLVIVTVNTDYWAGRRDVFLLRGRQVYIWR